ncbi:MAG: hypothetical protein V1874_06790 [Spirochaetota bacterium]
MASQKKYFTIYVNSILFFTEKTATGSIKRFIIIREAIRETKIKMKILAEFFSLFTKLIFLDVLFMSIPALDQ